MEFLENSSSTGSSVCGPGLSESMGKGSRVTNSIIQGSVVQSTVDFLK